MTKRSSLTSLLVPTLLPLLADGAPPSAANQYRLPPADVVKLVDASPTPRLKLSPDGSRYLIIDRHAMPSIADLSRPMLRLAGMRIDPVANGRHRTSFDKAITLKSLRGDADTVLPLPADARIATASWSPDSRHFYYTLVTSAGTELWGATVDTADGPRRLTSRLNTIPGNPRWMPDGRRLVCWLVPKDRGDEPEAATVPGGPTILETSGVTSPLRTYQDLLANEHDEALFDHYATTELALIAVGGPVTATSSRIIGTPMTWYDAEPSPDGRYLLVSRLHKPYSYLMPAGRFPQRISVMDLRSGREHVIVDVPLGEDIPLHGVRTGPRSVTWRPGENATLYWTEALDEGDPENEVPHRDRWMTQSAPFDASPREMFRVEQRSWGLAWFEDPMLVISAEYDRDRRWIRRLLHDLSDADAEPRIMEDRSIRDRYGDPGSLVRMDDGKGWSVVRRDGDWVYLVGSGTSPQGLHPFLDRKNIVTMATERLWQCSDGTYELVANVIGTSRGDATFITKRESPTEPPNYVLHDGDRTVQITDFADPTPQIRGITKELVTYERYDGVPLSATLYLPANYQEGERLPLIVWAYPIEFNDAKTAGQIGRSPYRFTRISGYSHLHLLTQGYAIMDGATMPVIGDPETMNDTFVEQIVGAGRAAVDKAVEMGVADPDRVAVGGHSYGAFMTANLMAHCDFFKAGVARSGAYNRTLTPFGFQAERRTFWEAPEIYFSMSPFMHADKINEPLLLIHGEADNNSGTFPMQSRRLYQAIKGNGGTARLVMLPNESHGYRARESVLHVLAETIDWLDEYVKNAE